MDSSDISSSFHSLQIPTNHTTVGLSNLISSNSQTKSLFLHKRLPDYGWNDIHIQRLLYELSCLDTNCLETVKCILGNRRINVGIEDECYGRDNENNCIKSSVFYPHRWTGAGEREGRIYSPLVSQRHFGLGHGIGRSGDVMEAQPKAVGSSALLRLTLRLALDAVKRGAGLSGDSKNGGPASFGTLLPVCTGMSMALVLAGLRDRQRHLDDVDGLKHGSNVAERKIVLWSRIDQKSCFKAILSAGLKCIVVPTRKHPQTDEVSTDLEAMEEALNKYGNSVLAIVTTTSCFCPRVPDEVDKVAKLVQSWNETNSTTNRSGAGISHVINHAYGLQCAQTNKLLNRACTIGRVDAVICSTDKNFLVPVGGALILSPESGVIEAISKNYPGRASASPMIDLFITLLSMGLEGYKGILEERRRLTGKFLIGLERVAKNHGERVLNCPRNTISFGMTLDNLAKADSHYGSNNSDENNIDQQKRKQQQKEHNSQITKFGSMLFTRCISGTRVIPQQETKSISGHTFQGFGSSHNNYPFVYMTAACAVGLGEEEMNEFFLRLDKCLKDYYSKKEKEKKKKDRIKEC